MKRLITTIILSTLLFILPPVRTVSAQHGDAPPLPVDAWKGEVSGKVVNQSTGETVTEPIDVMLHIWDTEGQERLMLHGQTGPDGAFSFEDVDFHQTFVVSVMSTFQGASYYSEPVNIQKGDASIIVNGNVYDTTTDLATITIEQLHMLFYSEGGQLGVTQFYALSNSGKLTVKDAVTLPRDRTATLKFHLPDEAENVIFGNDDTGERYVLLAGGFADTAPLPPGEGSSQVIVGYNLPYAGKLNYDFIAPVAVEKVSLLVLQDSGLSLEGDGLIPGGERALQDGSKFRIFTASGVEPGDVIQLTLSGELADGIQMESAVPQTDQNEKNIGLGVGAGMLGLALLVAGIWWWRRGKDEEGEDEEGSEDIIPPDHL